MLQLGWCSSQLWHLVSDSCCFKGIMMTWKHEVPDPKSLNNTPFSAAFRLAESPTSECMMLRCFQPLRSGCFTPSTGGHGGQLRPQWCIHCNDFSTTTSSLEKWQRRCQRLQSLLRRVEFPRPESFEVNGKVYELPVRSGPPTCHSSREELEYLGGFFDGDGCVSLCSTSGGVLLSVSQSAQRPSILLRFRAAFGGGIHRDRGARGTRHASLRWQATGNRAQEAASVLHSLTIMKSAQLHQVLDARICGRNKVVKTLLRLKAHTHEPGHGTGNCTWPYFAGLFDAEGCIFVQALRPSISLNVSQTNPYILRVTLAFLENEGLGNWNLYKQSRGSYQLICQQLDTAKGSLEKLLSHGLSLKRPQAEHCLALTEKNHAKTRQAVSQLNGQQSLYKRLDGAGIERAKAIHKLQTKLSRLRQRHCREKDNQITVAIEAQLQELQEEHKLGNLQSRCTKFRVQLRKVLSEGGVLSPVCPAKQAWQNPMQNIKRCETFCHDSLLQHSPVQCETTSWYNYKPQAINTKAKFPSILFPMLIHIIYHFLSRNTAHITSCRNHLSPGGASHNGTELPGSRGQTIASRGAAAMLQFKVRIDIPW